MGNATVSRMDLALLRGVFDAAGEPPYRTHQAWQWAARGAASYGEMTNLPAALRERLESEVPFSTLEVEREERARDGTVKALFRTGDGHPVRSEERRVGKEWRSRWSAWHERKKQERERENRT